MNGISRPHPAQVPTLTEIIDVQGQPSTARPIGAPATAAPVKPQAPVSVVRPTVPLDALPVLGEVVPQGPEQRALPSSDQPLQASPPLASAPAPHDAPPAVSEAQLAHRVLSDVQRQIDGMLEYRLKEAMAPLLARHTEAIARDLRDELNRTLKDVIARSVAQELAKLRQR